MLAANILKALRLSPGSVSCISSACASNSRRNLLINCQQARHMARKSIGFRTRYGIPPMFQDDDYQKRVEEGKLNDLQYEKIRFAKLSENNSPLYDNDYEKFVNVIMQAHGRKALAYRLMHQTFYLIKCYQLARYRKRLAKMEQNKGNETTTIAASQQDDDDNLANIETDPMKIFKLALANIRPMVVTKKVKRGGAIYQVPFPVDNAQSEWLAVKWLIQAVKDRPKRRVKLFPEVMAQELIDAANNRGKVVKKKDDIHRLANANRAYAHYRWG